MAILDCFGIKKLEWPFWRTKLAILDCFSMLETANQNNYIISIILLEKGLKINLLRLQCYNHHAIHCLVVRFQVVYPREVHSKPL